MMDKLNQVGYNDGKLMFSDVLPSGSKSHQEVPYMFKPYAIKEAYNLGYRHILWMDAPVYPEKSVNTLFDIIERDGYLIFKNGWTNGHWTSDRALEYLGISREDAFNQPHAMACVMGFDLSREDVMAVFTKWMNASEHAYPGEWKNTGICSSDSRVLGHRHDQSIISTYAYQAGWNFMPTDENKLITYGNESDYILYSRPV
jgi:hypothetical protein